jgi:hypothetical protein
MARSGTSAPDPARVSRATPFAVWGFEQIFLNWVRFAHLMCAPDIEHSGTSAELGDLFSNHMKPLGA